MYRRTFLTSAVTVTTLLSAGCSARSGSSSPSGGSAVKETTEITMVNSQFDPRNTHVDAGATVTWTNEDSTAHTVTSASDNWSKNTRVAGGEKTTHTFDESGVYDVYCRFHGSTDLSGMSMKIGVGDATIDDPLGSSSGGGTDTESGGYY